MDFLESTELVSGRANAFFISNLNDSDKGCVVSSLEILFTQGIISILALVNILYRSQQGSNRYQLQGTLRIIRSGDFYLVRFSDCLHFAILELNASSSFPTQKPYPCLEAWLRNSIDTTIIFLMSEFDMCSGLWSSGQPRQHSESTVSSKTLQNENKTKITKTPQSTTKNKHFNL